MTLAALYLLFLLIRSLKQLLKIPVNPSTAQAHKLLYTGMHFPQRSPSKSSIKTHSQVAEIGFPNHRTSVQMIMSISRSVPSIWSPQVAPHIVVSRVLFRIELSFCLRASFALKVLSFCWSSFRIDVAPFFYWNLAVIACS